MLAFALTASPAGADETLLHGEVGLAHAVVNPQASEYGFGAGASIAGELIFARVFGLQAEVSVLGLADGDPPSNPAIANHGAAFEVGAMAGVRLHPFRSRLRGGLWIDGNGGIVFTGDLARASFDAHVGYDFRPRDGRLEIGPFVGYTQVFQPADTLRPEDAHVVIGGLHVALGSRRRPPVLLARTDRDGDGIYDDVDACPDTKGVATSDPATNGCPRGDRDHDLVFDDEDACPDEPGVRTADPKTNGCPRPDRDHDLVFDDEDACPDVPGRRTGDPKTNGCPRIDRDNDTVFDDEDACPDIPGLRTTDAKTNGCPAAGDQVRLEGDKLVLDDIIHFDVDSPRIRHPSWTICKKVANFIQANPDVLEVDIEGHADETGTDAHNLVLSRHRAEAVKRILVESGVDPTRITTHAYGESRPRVVGHAEEQLRQNRRVEFTVTRSRARSSDLKETVAPAVPASMPIATAPPAPPSSSARPGGMP